MKLLWMQDECAPDELTAAQAYRKLTGVEFNRKSALEEVDHGDCVSYRFPDGLVVTMGTVETSIKLDLERAMRHALHLMHCGDASSAELVLSMAGGL